jgi:hypothetical protein
MVRMVRAHLATLTLAGGLVLSLAGCCGGIGDRLRGWRDNRVGYPAGMDCTCHDVSVPHGAVPTSLEAGGPMLMAPGMMAPGMTPPPPPPPPGGQIPMGPPPRIITTPATTTPWTGH